MNSNEGLFQDRLTFIDNQLLDIDNNLEEYFKSYNVEQLSRILNEDNEELIIKNNTLSKLSHQDGLKKTDYIQIIEICNQLWVVNGLVNELTHQTQFENKISSYIKLDSKTNEIRNQINDFNDVGSIKIFKELNDKISEIKYDLIKEADKQLNDYLFIADNLEIEFTYYKDNLEFSKFLKYCRYLNNLENNNISHFNFNKILKEWLQSILEKIDKGFSIIFEQNDNILKLKIEKCEVNLLNFIKSIGEIIKFFDILIEKFKTLVEFKNIRFILGKIILKCIKIKIFSKENVYPLIIDKLNYDENHVKDSKISIISELYKISKLLSSHGWSKDGICELEFWIDDLTSSWIDNLLDYTIDELKLFVISINNNEKSDMLKEKNLISQEIDLIVKDTDTVTQKNENDWSDDWDDNEGWNNDKKILTESKDKNSSLKVIKTEKEEEEDIVDDGGWGDDDLDLDDDEDEDEKKSFDKEKQKQKEKEEEEEDDDEWGAWGDEVKIDDDDIDKELPEIDEYKNKQLIPSFKYSKLVDEIMTIFDNYMKNYDDLKQLEVNKNQIEEANDLFKHGFKKLCISYFMMLDSDASEIYQNDILFYNDYNKILEECYKRYEVDLTTCFKMNFRFITSYQAKIYGNLFKIINDYDKAIWDDTHFDDESILQRYKKEFLIRFDNEFDNISFILNKLSSLNTQLIVNTFVTVIFQSFDIICNKILKRTDISSFESEILSGIIEVIISHTIEKTRYITLDLDKIQSFNKLKQIQFILSSNLKGILNLFYDAKLYEIETHELISLIQSLFIDSTQRSNAITEIKTIRETQA
ncbi:hypothetical protein C6P40_004944 [Pichia californica]|uniref:Retrograde transport protein Dsl1 C-terminal domain-containing protein n=1 Tax=Pichia californica TaxID=460514 RepID=A0A9P6WM08_9ASCO|nr:hypothetical protein C6P42_000576 [[Candida] californica]KAG0689485.1 hypothetical protein C6P40_004944 [[Candida] californica]